MGGGGSYGGYGGFGINLGKNSTLLEIQECQRQTRTVRYISDLFPYSLNSFIGVK